MTKQKQKHWTAENINKFKFSVLCDVVDQLYDMGLEPEMVPDTVGIASSFELDEIVKLVRSLGLKMTIVVYDDDDDLGERGPINSHVFRECWEKAGKPRNNWDLSKDLSDQDCITETVTLEDAVEGAKRASKRVGRWPDWKRKVNK